MLEESYKYKNPVKKHIIVYISIYIYSNIKWAWRINFIIYIIYKRVISSIFNEKGSKNIKINENKREKG